MTVDLAALAKLASEATPGPWSLWVDMVRASSADDRMIAESVYGADAAYIAAASPNVVAALVRVALAAKTLSESVQAVEMDDSEYLTMKSVGPQEVWHLFRAALADLDANPVAD